MKRQLLILSMLSAVLVCVPMSSADARDGGGRGNGRGKGIRVRDNGNGFGAGGVFFDGCEDLAELYRELLNNVPYFALHPPVYYSCPVPRTYGYSPFAYPPYVLTPEIVGEVQPLEIINPHVPSTQHKPASAEKDRTATTSAQPEPLVIINPYVTPTRAVAQSDR